MASFGGPKQYQSRTEQKVGGRKDEVKLKGRENFKIQINEETKINLSKVIQGQAAADKTIPKLNLSQLQ